MIAPQNGSSTKPAQYAIFEMACGYWVSQSLYVAAKLGIADDRVVHNIERYGNTTAATIPIGISESWREGKIREGSRVLMVAFGAGFTWAGGVAVF